MPILLLPLAVFGTILFLGIVLVAPRETVIQARLKAYGYGPRANNTAGSLLDRVIFPALQRTSAFLLRLSPWQMDLNVRRRLAQAGQPYGFNSSTFQICRILFAGLLVFVVDGSALSRGQYDPRTVIFGVVAVLIGWRVPMAWLSFRVDARIFQIERALPDALDLIVVCVEAGNSLEQAIAAVVRRLAGPLADELRLTLGEMSLGKTRRDALHDLSQRTGSRDLQTFVAAVLQSDRLGVSIAQTLRVQADAARVRRRQRAEEIAATLPVKMLIPLVLFIFPSIMIVILGPAASRIFGFFSTVK